jgi:hypothetical protein
MALKSASGLVPALRSLLAMALAWAMFCLANIAGSGLATLAGFPSGGGGRLAWDLAWVIVAGVLAAAVAAALAPRAPRVHVLALFAMLLAIAVLAVARLGGDWPWWFSAGIVATLPLQAWLGARRVLRWRAGRHAPAPLDASAVADRCAPDRAARATSPLATTKTQDNRAVRTRPAGNRPR